MFSHIRFYVEPNDHYTNNVNSRIIAIWNLLPWMVWGPFIEMHRGTGSWSLVSTSAVVTLWQHKMWTIDCHSAYTLHVNFIFNAGSVQLELCICCKFADLECAECHSRGYCSEQCQQQDWYRHILACQIISDKKHKKHKKKKKKKGKGKKTVLHAYTPSLTLCICGKETEFECSRCGQQGYCSEECQLEDWSFHEHHCLAPSESSAPPSGRSIYVCLVCA